MSPRALGHTHTAEERGEWHLDGHGCSPGMRGVAAGAGWREAAELGTVHRELLSCHSTDWWTREWQVGRMSQCSRSSGSGWAKSVAGPGGTLRTEQKDSNVTEPWRNLLRPNELHPECTVLLRCMGRLQCVWSSRCPGSGQYGALAMEFECNSVLIGVNSWRGLATFTMQKLYIKNMFFKAPLEAYTYKSNPAECH